MEAFAHLWVPILLAAVLVFIASSIAWMLLPHHKKEWSKLPNEAPVKSALEGVAPGQYMVPFGERTAPWVASVLLQRNTSMGRRLTLWFLNQVLIAALAAYLLYYALPPEAEYLHVMRVVGTALVLGQIGALFARAIWWGWQWSSVVAEAIEGIVYALLAAGVFSWWWTR